MSTAKEKINEKLWNMMLAQDNHITQEFTTSVVGIGALFFAYVEAASSPFVPYAFQFLIAAIGLGASLVMCVHIYVSLKQSKAIQDKLTTEDPSLMVSWNEIMRLRGRPRGYFEVKRLMGEFSALVVVGWITVILRYEDRLQQPWWVVEAVAGAAVIFTAGFELWSLYRDKVNLKNPQADLVLAPFKD